MSESASSTQPMRRIRSFVRREGRLTRGQQRALEQLYPVSGLDTEVGHYDLNAVFGRSAPKSLEIGFGDGQALLQRAEAHPELDCLGIEVHRPGVGNLLLQIEKQGIQNVRVLCADAAEVLAARFDEAVFDEVHILFPDPWPKKRHHKRRLIQPQFVAILRRRLKPGGRLYLATDWQDYAEHMMRVMREAPGYRNPAGKGNFSERGERPATKFEDRGRRRGHGVWDLVFERSD